MAVTVEELGRRTKEKYPAYHGYSDAEVGQRVLAKYPQYQAQVTQQPEPTQPGGILQTLTNLIGGKSLTQGIAQSIAAPGVQKTLNEAQQTQDYVNAAALRELKTAQQRGDTTAVQKLTDILKKAGQQPQPTVEDIVGQFKTPKEVAGSAASLALLAAPGTGATTFGAKLAEGVATGAAAGAAGALDENGNAKDVLRGASFGSLFGSLFPVAGAGLQKAGQYAGLAGEAIALKGLRPSPTQIKNFSQKTGRDLADFVIENKFFGRGEDQLAQVQRVIDEVQGQFNQIAKESNRKIPVSDLTAGFDARIKELTDSIDPADVQKANQLKLFRDKLVNGLEQKAQAGDQIVRTPGLSPEDATIEANTQQQALANYDQYKQQYLSKPKMAKIGPNGELQSVTLNTDEWRDLFPQYTGLNSHVVHEASSKLNTKLFAEALQTQKGKGNGILSVLAGGGGSGKSIASELDSVRQAPLILDQVTGDGEKFIKKVLVPARENGYKVEVAFVDRNPRDAFVEGVVKRAIKKRNAGELPRVVQLKRAVEDNINARKTAIQMIEQADKYGVPVRVIDNNGKQGAWRLIEDPKEALDYLKSKKYYVATSTKEIRNELSARQSGIPADIYEALIGEGPISGGRVQHGRAVRGDRAGRPGAGRLAAPTAGRPLSEAQLPGTATGVGQAQGAGTPAPATAGLVNVADISAAKTQYGQSISPKDFLADPVNASARRESYAITQKTVENATKDLTGPNGESLKELGKKLRSLYEFKGLAENRANLGRSTIKRKN